MIKYLYFIFSAIIAICAVEGIPVIDIFSSSWHSLTYGTLMLASFFSVFGIIISLIAYTDERDNPTSDFGQFFLRHLVGQKFLPKWPVVIWAVLAAVFVQFNQLSLAIAVGILTVFAASIVFVQNGLYTTYLKQEAKGE